jgi:hypothetical protein
MLDMQRTVMFTVMLLSMMIYHHIDDMLKMRYQMVIRLLLIIGSCYVCILILSIFINETEWPAELDV